MIMVIDQLCGGRGINGDIGGGYEWVMIIRRRGDGRWRRREFSKDWIDELRRGIDRGCRTVVFVECVFDHGQ